MSLPNLIIALLAWIAASALVGLGWIVLCLTGRVQRLEQATGAWRVQEPAAPQPLSHTRLLTDEEYEQLCADWHRERGRDAA